MTQDLFEYADHYPATPGHRRVPTSIEAADKVERSSLKEKCYRDIIWFLTAQKNIGSTSYEFADKMGYKHSFCQPRFSELNKLERIMRSDMRRTNHDGNTVSVWVIR